MYAFCTMKITPLGEEILDKMFDSMKEKIYWTEQQHLKSQLKAEQKYLKTDRDRYIECMNGKLLVDRKTPQEIRDGLILYWNVYRFIVDKE